MKTVCCVCRKLKAKDDWVDTDREETPTDSHGYCPKCAKEALGGLLKQLKEERK